MCTLHIISLRGRVRWQSLSLGPGGRDRRKPQPICDLAYNPEEIKARLAGIPVYTVANKQNEFVLVAGEVRNPSMHPISSPATGLAFPALPASEQCWRLRAVYCSVQSGGEVRQLGLIFLSEADAHALVEKVRTHLLS